MMSKKLMKLKSPLKMSVLIIFMLITQIAASNLNNYDTGSKIEKEIQNTSSPGEIIPELSSISGNELFAEQISVEIASDKSMIQQTFITNDTNIFAQIDFSDPAFSRSAFYLSSSNVIQSEISPGYITQNTESNENLPCERMNGFIYYDNQTSKAMVQIQKERALAILKETFKLDFVFQNQIEDNALGYYYPFFGYYPDWDQYFSITTANLPKDGYWGTFDVERLTSTDYISNSHLSSNILYMKSFEMLEYGFANLSARQLDLDFDLSSLDILSSLTNVIDNLGESGILELLGTTGEDLQTSLDDLNLEEMTDNLLTELTNVVFFSTEYEGQETAITQEDNNQYTFDLFDAIGYEGNELLATSKSFNSLIGILLSGIIISLDSAEVIETNPEHIFFSEYNIERLQSILFLIDSELDLSVLLDYSFNIGWQSNNFVSQLVTVPENLGNQSDFINYLQILGFIGFPMILGSIINPLEQFKLTYQLTEVEPSLHVTKTIDDASNVLFEEPLIEILVENRGNQPVWGQELDLSALGIYNDPYSMQSTLNLALGIDIGPFFEAMQTLGYNISEYFHDDNPRFISVDTNGTGIADYLYPEIDIFDLFTFFPYSSEFSSLLVENATELGAIFPGGAIGLIAFALLFNSSSSIFNPNNWKLDPGDSFTITVSNYNNTLSDTYSSIYDMNLFIQPNISPIISYGSIIGGTSPYATYQPSDNITWNLRSESLTGIETIQQYLIFKNESNLDFSNKNIDELLLDIQYDSNFNFSENPMDIVIEIFDNTLGTNGEFVQIEDTLIEINQNYINFTLSGIEYNLSRYFNDLDDYSVLLRITYEKDTNFDMYFDSISFSFLDRDLNLGILLPARVIYSSEIGKNQYTQSSNSIILGTDNLASIYGVASINTTESYCGEIIEYSLDVYNIGNLDATNIEIEITEPGIITNLENIQYFSEDNNETVEATAGNFTISNGTLSYSFEIFPAHTSITNLKFEFYAPNSMKLPSSQITWEDNQSMNDEKINYLTFSNDVILSAPFNYLYENSTPFIGYINASYITDFMINSPLINETFYANFSIMNPNNFTIYDILIEFPQNIPGLEFLGENDSYWINSLTSEEIYTVTLKYKKVDFSGYCIPNPLISLRFQPTLFKINYGTPQALGQFNLQIIKEYDTIDSEEGTIFEIKVTTTNLGTLEVGNFTINDIWSYDAAGFTLVEGLMVKKINFLLPGESSTFTYKLKILEKGTYTMNPAETKYYFQFLHIVQSEEISFKVREKYAVLTARLYGPMLIGLVGVVFAYYYKTHYNREELEFERRETLLFGQSFRESSWHKKNIIEFFEDEKTKLTINKTSEEN